MFNKRDALHQEGNDNFAIQNSDVSITVSANDVVAQYAAEGRYDEAIQLIQKLRDQQDAIHPFWPHYRFKTIQIGSSYYVEHEPRSLEDAERFPLSYRGQFKFPEEDLSKYNDIDELLHEAFLNQREIKIDVVALQALIDNVDVPTPFLEENTKDGEWIIKPQPLPESIKVKIFLSSEDLQEIPLIDYAELSIGHFDHEKKIIVIDNRRQEHSKLLFSLTLDLNAIETSNQENAVAQNAKFDFTIKEEFKDNIEANLMFLNLLKKTSEHTQYTLTFKNLVNSSNFMSSKGFKSNSSVSENLERDIKFVKRLYKIEQHFNVIFSLPEKLTSDDYEGIQSLESIINKVPLKKKFIDLTFDVSSKETLENFIGNLQTANDEPQKIKVEYTGEEGRIELFGATIPLKKIERTFFSAKPENLEKITNKAKYMDEGEIIKMKFIPSEDPTMEEQFFI